jgi:hypothetical protein
MNTSRVSAVALIDVLGFKGIEKRHDPKLVAAAMNAARDAITSVGKFISEIGALHANILGGAPSIKIGWFSDTICMVAQQPEDPHSPGDAVDIRVRLVDIMALSVGYLLSNAARSSGLPLTFRGAVTVGNALVEDGNVYFGPAIEEAASLYELADGAFVWLSPEASALPKLRLPASDRALVDYDVPLKSGQSLRTRVVNPFMDTAPNRPERQEIRQGIERAMEGHRLDIAIKRQNTLRFLDHVAEGWSQP